MKNLARHIELLLRDNDCVILPGFGGFIAHDVPAYYISEEGLYYPPTRSISFNAAITMNDGLLTQSYMKSYQADYARASYMVDMAIEQLVDTLDEEGTVVLPRIGVLKQDINQALQFIPDEAGVASPLHFGLGAFGVKELNKLVVTEANQHPEASANHVSKTISLHIHKDVLHRVMSTAAVLLLLLMIALPTGNHRPTDVASLHLTEFIAATQAQPTTSATNIDTACIVAVQPITEAPTADMQPEETTFQLQESKCNETEQAETPQATDEPIVVQEQAIVEEAPAVDLTPAPAATVVSEKTYHIIVASLPSHRGAEETLSQYTHMGYSNVSLVERDARVRVSLMKFTDKDEANEQLKVLRQNEKFQNAWLLAVRN